MVNGKKLVVSASPHLRSTQTTTRIMLDVVISLIPALIAAIFIFGPRVLCVAAVSVSSAVLAEYVSRKVMKRHQTIGDLSAVVTGLILALNLPSTIPYWIAAIGSIVAIVVVKQFFGGIGQNFANPAITAMMISCADIAAQSLFSSTMATTAASTGASIQNLLATVPVASSTRSPGPAPT